MAVPCGIGRGVHAESKDGVVLKFHSTAPCDLQPTPLASSREAMSHWVSAWATHINACPLDRDFVRTDRVLVSMP